MKLNVSLSSASIAGEFTLGLFNVRTVAHMLHLNTRSFATHKALDEFYTSLVPLTDRFAESAIGHFKAIEWPGDMTIALSAATDPVAYLQTVKVAVDRVSGMLEQEDLKNIVAEILELTTSTIYKLENLG